MKKISYYYLYYTPKGTGLVVFRLENDATDYSTGPLSSNELAAVAAVLAQSNISYDPTQKTFGAFDRDDEEHPLTKFMRPA
ncbi:hypothetical protein [Hymenobacter negativus]|uniref:Uncharacterized protein n=1 Tax=Hymenobacter negativus TaxID=2795026 RepID=A0ABS3QBF3_9BACT|nr:hypothetical protein [Hymenobacter negativus]MBO2008343.1 hypothetical protein [Hymenobacter negativus]